MTKKKQTRFEVASEVVDIDGAPVSGETGRSKSDYPIRLRTLENIHSEMNRVYRDARGGRMRTEECNKLVWALTQIKVVIEAINNTEQAERILEIEARLGLAKALGGNVRQLSAVPPAPATGTDVPQTRAQP